MRAVTQVNFLAAASLALDAVGAMLAAGRGGAIVNVSSFAADCVPPREASYAASKAALRAFTARRGSAEHPIATKALRLHSYGLDSSLSLRVLQNFDRPTAARS